VSALMTERRDRDSKGHFIRGNVPWNKRRESIQRGITFTCKLCHNEKPIEELEVLTRFFPPLPCCRDCRKLLE